MGAAPRAWSAVEPGAWSFGAGWGDAECAVRGGGRARRAAGFKPRANHRKPAKAGYITTIE